MAHRKAERTLRLAIDAITPGASLDSSAGGMRMYLTTLIRKMGELGQGLELLVLESRQFPLSELDGLPGVTRIECPHVPPSRYARIVYQNTILPMFLRSLKSDVLLATCNVLPVGCPVPSVVVVQSLQYFDYPKAYGRLRAAYLRAALRHASRNASALICPSESSRRELIRLTGVAEANVRVVHHGVSGDISDYVGDSVPTSPPYVLCVATLYRYKNLERLIEAFAAVKAETGIPHRLRIVGGEADISFAELVNHAAALGVAESLELVGPLPHDRIASEYAHASLFVYPSLEETFGLPLIEAMTLGVPVVASRVASIPEIVGNAAELVDPFSVKDICRGMSRVLRDTAYSDSLVSLGTQRAKKFSWDNSARLTLLAVQSVFPTSHDC